MAPVPPSRTVVRSGGGVRQPISSRVAGKGVLNPAAKAGTRPQPAGQGVDHWTMVLFYAMGVGVLALILFFILSLALIGLYGQFVWTFTHWDLASVQTEMVRPWVHFAMIIVFSTGMIVGIWFFGGYAWRHLKNRRMVNAATRVRR